MGPLRGNDSGTRLVSCRRGPLWGDTADLIPRRVPSGAKPSPVSGVVVDGEAPAAEQQLEIEQHRVGLDLDPAGELSATQAGLQVVELVALHPEHFVHDQPRAQTR